MAGFPATIAGHQCAVALDGATGNEPNGHIPVCCTPDAADGLLVDEMFTLLNAHRQANGVGVLTYDVALEAAIQGHCLHMALHPFFDNIAPEAAVSSMDSRAQFCGTTAQAENVASGTSDAQSMMNTLTGDPGTNDVMLNPAMTRVGIGYYQMYWGQLFGP